MGNFVARAADELFKVSPLRRMILGQPVEQTSYSLAAQVLGWIYHSATAQPSRNVPRLLATQPNATGLGGSHGLALELGMC